jgi:hypothetical protein
LPACRCAEYGKFAKKEVPILRLTFQYRGRYKLPGPADTFKYRLEVVAGGKTVAVLDKVVEQMKKHRVGAQEYGFLIEDMDLPPGGELKFVSTGTDAVRIDNIRWKDHDGIPVEKSLPAEDAP